MTKSTKIEVAYIGSKLTNLPKYAVLAGLLFSVMPSIQGLPVNADVASEKPALLALADVQSLSVSARDISYDEPIMLTAFNGSTLSNLANPFVIVKNASQKNIATAALNTQTNPVLLSQNVIDVRYGVLVTAYSSTVDQCDDSPFITANGTYVHDGIVAANWLPFGTKIRIPEYFGDKIFTVEDRMAKRNNLKVDIWMETREQALQFGARRLTIEIVK